MFCSSVEGSGFKSAAWSVASLVPSGKHQFFPYHVFKPPQVGAVQR